MTEAQIALARRAVACCGWSWMPGMLAAGPPGPRGGQKLARVEGILTSDDWTPRCVDFMGRRVPAHYACKCSEEDVMPDLTDAATLGCLLELVREQHKEPRLHVRWSDVSCRYEVVSRYRLHGDALTEAEALVIALETVPAARLQYSRLL